MKNKIIIISLILTLIILPIISAQLTCDSIQDITYETGITTEQKLSFVCNNPPNVSVVTLSKKGTGISYFDFGSAGNTITSPGTKTFTLDFNKDATPGLYSGKVEFDDGSPTLSFILEVTGQLINPTNCNVNPTNYLSYSRSYMEGSKTTVTFNFNPINCDTNVLQNAVLIGSDIMGVDGINKPIDIGTISPNSIDMEINTEGLISRTYQDIKLQIGSFRIPIAIIVTSSSSPSGNLDINNLPTCSLSNNIINLNDTHSLVCTNLIPDVEIVPIVDDNYIRGINLEKESNQWTWLFQGKKYGNSIVKAGFYYLGVPVGDFFEQVIKIQSSSGQTPGTELEFKFTPKLEDLHNDERVIIQLIDNKSGNLIINPSIYIDAISLDPLNNSEKSFPYIFKVGTNYELRGETEGYNNLIKIINISSKKMGIQIVPQKNMYTVGDTVNITTNENASLMVNDIVIISPYTFLSPGNKTIKAVKDGYVSSNLTISVKSKITYRAVTPKLEEWKKGTEVLLELTENITWVVYKDSELIESGEGNLVKFEIPDYGLIQIKKGDTVVFQRNVEKNSWYDKTWDWIKGLGWWWIAIILVVGVLVYFLFIRNREQLSSTGFGGTSVSPSE